MTTTLTKTYRFKVGDICYATYSYASQHNYFLEVVKRTDKTVTFRQIECAMSSHDGYGQNGYNVPATDNGNYVYATDYNGEPVEYKNRRIKVLRDGNEVASIGEYIGYVYEYDGKPLSFYSD